MRPLPNSPDSFGAHRYSCFPHAGPAPYTQVVVESPPPAVPSSGGDLVQAVEAGLSLFDFVIGGMSDSGLYFVRAVPVSDSSQMPGSQQSTYRLVWYVASTGVEVPTGFTLSGEVVRLIAFGIK